MAASDIALEKGLPSNIDAEKFVLGAILLDDSNFVQVAGLLEVGGLQAREAPAHLPADARPGRTAASASTGSPSRMS